MIEQMMRVTQLYDMYKGLLTQRQQRCFELHYFQDFSFAEVGAEMGVTRQAANDIVQRAVEQMQLTEDKVGFMQKQYEVRAGLQCVQKDLRAGQHEAALDRIENMLRNEAS